MVPHCMSGGGPWSIHPEHCPQDAATVAASFTHHTKHHVVAPAAVVVAAVLASIAATCNCSHSCPAVVARLPPLPLLMSSCTCCCITHCRSLLRIVVLAAYRYTLPRTHSTAHTHIAAPRRMLPHGAVYRIIALTAFASRSPHRRSCTHLPRTH